MNDPSKIEFLIFCIGNAAESLGVSGAVAYRKLAVGELDSPGVRP